MRCDFPIRYSGDDTWHLDDELNPEMGLDAWALDCTFPHPRAAAEEMLDALPPGVASTNADEAAGPALGQVLDEVDA